MRRALVVSVLSLLLIASAAKAIAPIPIVGAAVSGLGHAALIYFLWFKRDVKPTPTAPPVAVYISTKQVQEEPNPQDLPAPTGAPARSIPATTTSQPTGGTVTFTVPPHTVNNVSYSGVTITASPVGVVQALRSLDPAKVHPSYYDSRITGRDTAAYATVTQKYKPTTSSNGDSIMNPNPLTASPTYQTTTYVGQYVSIVYSGANGSIIYNLPVQDGQWSPCPAGFTRNSNPSICDLTNLEEAKSSPASSRDYKCVVRGTTPNPFDPDCAALSAAGAFTEQTTASGAPAMTLRDPSTPGTVNGIVRHPDGSSTLTQLTKNPDGSSVRDDLPLSQDGNSGPVSRAVTPANPPEEFPGQSGGSGGPGTGTGTGNSTCDPSQGPVPAACYGVSNTAHACGGPSQQPCNMNTGSLEGKLDGIKDAVGEAGKSKESIEIGGDGEEPSSTGHAGDSLINNILGLRGVALSDPGYSCAYAWDLGASSSTDLNFTGYGGSIPVQMNLAEACPLIEPHEDNIRNVFLVLWYVAAIVMFVRWSI